MRLTNESLFYSARNCGLHFSLDRQRGFFPEHCLETVRDDVTLGTSGVDRGEERDDVGRTVYVNHYSRHI